jgi:hypothetical protein
MVSPIDAFSVLDKPSDDSYNTLVNLFGGAIYLIWLAQDESYPDR